MLTFILKKEWYEKIKSGEKTIVCGSIFVRVEEPEEWYENGKPPENNKSESREEK